MKRTLLLLTIILLAGLAAADNHDTKSVDTVILASTANYPDALISSAPGNKIGAPVLLTDKDQLSTETSQALDQLDPEEVIIVGGPSVISEQVETQVSEKANTTRLWGMTQTGTSIAVSEYFWTEGSEKATIVQYPQDSEGYKILSAVKDEVADDDEPILISKEGTVSASVLSEIERLGATEVKVYSTNAVNVTEDLEEIGVTNVEVEEAEREQLLEQLKERDRERIQEQTQKTNSTLVIVAAANFRHAISVPNLPNSSTFIVGSEDQIDEAVSLAGTTDAENIKVVGKPDLAQQISSEIESQTDREVDFVSGENAARVAAEVAEERREHWEEIQERKMEKWEEHRQNSDRVQKAANHSLKKARSLVDTNSSEHAQELLEEAEEAYSEGDYFEAHKKATRAASETRRERYREMDQTDIQDEIEDEREDLHEAVTKLTELNHEFKQEIREAETREEKLEVIREFKSERAETIRELRERARKNREDVRDEIKDRKEDLAEHAGNSEVKLSAEGNTVRSRFEYTAPTGGYTVEKNVEHGNNTVVFSFQLSSPDGPATQALTRYRERSRVELENGTYNVRVALTVDGETVNKLQKEITVPSTVEYENEIENEKEEKERTSETEASEAESVEHETHKVVYTSTGFEPATLEISQGDKVVWVDNSTEDMWIASNAHPDHTNYDSTTRSEHCADDSDIDPFDQCDSGDEFSFEFSKTGDWNYHNHLAASDQGSVIVR